MKTIRDATLALLAVLLLSVDGWTETTTKSTKIGLSWRDLPKGKFDIANAYSPLPMGGAVYFRRDSGNGTVDDVIALTLSNGLECRTMASSTSNMMLRCGTQTVWFSAYRGPGTEGIEVELFEVVEAPDPPPPEAPHADEPAPKKKRVVPPPLPPNATAKGKVRT